MQQHSDDLLRAFVTEELAKLLFMPGDAVFLDQCNKVGRCVARQRRLTEVGIRGYEVVRVCVEISKVAAPSARNRNFLADAIRVFEGQDSGSGSARFNGPKKPG